MIWRDSIWQRWRWWQGDEIPHFAHLFIPYGAMPKTWISAWPLSIFLLLYSVSFSFSTFNFTEEKKYSFLSTRSRFLEFLILIISFSGTTNLNAMNGISESYNSMRIRLWLKIRGFRITTDVTFFCATLTSLRKKSAFFFILKTNDEKKNRYF